MIPYQPYGTTRTTRKPMSLAQRMKPVYMPVKTLGETFDEMLGFSPLLGDLLRLGGHGLGAWVGVYAGLYAKSKWMRTVGWFIGVGQGLTGVCDIVSIAQRLFKSAPQPQSTSEIQLTGVKGPEPMKLVK